MKGLFVLAVGLSLTMLSCGTKDDATLSVYAQELTVTKGTNSFGAKAEGSVKVYFELGSYATKGAHVDTISLSLARDSKVILGGNARFSPDTGELNLPLDVNPGEKKSIRYKISGTSPTEPLALTAAEATELCAGPVMVQGNVTYTGSSAPLPISAAPVSVSGCP